MPPHAGQRGTPSAASSRRRSSSSTGYAAPQSMQKFRSTLPCSSSTRSLPAFWCRPSMFCVTTADKVPACSSSASFRCARFGWASSASMRSL